MRKFTALLVLLLSVSSLSGCMTSAIVAASAGGSVITDKRSVRTQINDQQLRQSALANIRGLPEVAKNSHINASVYNDVLLLVGQTTSNEYREQAVTAAQRAGQFKRIYNRIETAELETFADVSEDTWLTTKIKAAMLSEKGLHSTQIKVVTEDTTVYLLGLVNKKQANLASDVARQIPGVTKVVKLFEYTS